MIRIFKYHLFFLAIWMAFASCTKDQNRSSVKIEALPEQKDISIIVLLGDGMGIPQLTAAWHQNNYLNLASFPYSGLMRTHSANTFVTESGSSATSMFSGIKTNYGYQGIDIYGENIETLYTYLKNQQYKTAIITSTFITDATLGALYSHVDDRYQYEKIALDYVKNYPDFCVGGGQIHFDQRSDGLNLLDSLRSKQVQIYFNEHDIDQINSLPALTLLHPTRPPYLSAGRGDFLKKSSLKALQFFDQERFFIFIEGGHIDLGGHDNNIAVQIEELLELDDIAGDMLEYAQSQDNVLVLVLGDHESGGLNLLSGEGMNYTTYYSTDEHSGSMVAVFAYGPGAENFTGLMDNTEIYDKLMKILQ